MQDIIFAIRQLTYNYAGIEIVDSDQDNEEIEDDDEYTERNCKNDEAPANISTRMRNSKKK